MNTVTPIRRALLSVSDKTGLIAFARRLADAGVELVSTGGTAKSLREAGSPIIDVSEVTGFPEMMDGRVKTLHPMIHGALLGRRADAGHMRAMAEHGIVPIDLLVVNLYPFEATVARGAAAEDAIETIDIGGPAMIRAAAKNAEDVTVIVDVADYGPVGDAIAREGGLDLDARRRLAAKAYGRTAAYDAAISNWFADRFHADAPTPHRAFGGPLLEALRYGENPHQKAAFYGDGSGRPGVARGRSLQGKPLSFNNINDADAAFELVSEFRPDVDGPACAIIKHANPCGVALGATLAEAYRRAKACDPVSAFGGVVAFNDGVDRDAAEAALGLFVEVVIAPDVTAEAAEAFAAKPNVRVITTGGLADPHAGGPTVRSVAGGLLVQDRDAGRIDPAHWTIVTERAPSEAEVRDLLFAFRVGKHVKSNAIVYAKDGATVGVGAGQMSRVDAARIAASKARDAAAAEGLPHPRTVGSAAASDAFFPFPDGLEAVVEAGATAIVQPGGSIRDEDVVAAADRLGVAMVFTGVRTFRH